jgi:hypothetical protein
MFQLQEGRYPIVDIIIIFANFTFIGIPVHIIHKINKKLDYFRRTKEQRKCKKNHKIEL